MPKPKKMNEETNSENNEKKVKSNELQAVEIAKVAEEKPVSSVSLIIFFVILLTVALGLPHINDLWNKLQGKPKIQTPTNDTSKDDDKDDDNIANDENKFYDLNNSTFSYDSLTFSNITLTYSSDYSVKFNISTTSDTSVALLNNYYYIELYNSEKTLLERVKLETDITVSKIAPQELELPINSNSYSSARLIKVTKIEEEDYLELILTEDSEKKSSLVCINGGNSITYRFTEAKLTEIEDLNTYNNTMANYEAFLNTKRSEVASLNNRNGISSSLVESNNGFVVSTLISLLDAGNQTNKYYYNLNTEPKIIDFEMEAMRFNCE